MTPACTALLQILELWNTCQHFHLQKYVFYIWRFTFLTNIMCKRRIKKRAEPKSYETILSFLGMVMGQILWVQVSNAEVKWLQEDPALLQRTNSCSCSKAVRGTLSRAKADSRADFQPVTFLSVPEKPQWWDLFPIDQPPWHSLFTRSLEK